VERLVAAAAIVAVVAVVAFVLDRRAQRREAPSQGTWPVPTQLDRADFARPDAQWLVVVFSSSTCESCATVLSHATVLESDNVAVQDVESVARRDLHERYGVEAVPTVVVADAEGVVQASFVGVPPAAELWAAVAEVRSD
jgi:thioredoxin-related protein